MVDKSTVHMIKKMSNKRLVHTINKIRKEKANPRVYGRYGTTRWVSSSEFWGGHHGVMKKELARRKKLGLIKKSAGKPREESSPFGFRPFRF